MLATVLPTYGIIKKQAGMAAMDHKTVLDQQLHQQKPKWHREKFSNVLSSKASQHLTQNWVAFATQ